jgi:hypothetical protein
MGMVPILFSFITVSFSLFITNFPFFFYLKIKKIRHKAVLSLQYKYYSRIYPIFKEKNF